MFFVIKIQMFTAGKFMTQLRESGLGVIMGAIGGTRFDAGPDTDQAVGDFQVELPFMSDGFLAFVTDF